MTAAAIGQSLCPLQSGIGELPLPPRVADLQPADCEVLRLLLPFQQALLDGGDDGTLRQRGLLLLARHGAGNSGSRSFMVNQEGSWISSALADMANEGLKERLLDEGLGSFPAKVKPVDGL